MGAHRGGHGGAWKVAYADFVTAMMALFLVLWIVASSQEVRESLAGYFRNNSLLQLNSKATIIKAPITQSSKRPMKTAPPQPSASSEPGGETWAYRVMTAQATLRETASSLQALLRSNNEELTDVDAFRFEFTNDGFRIHAMDKTEHPLFKEGTSELTEYGQWVLNTIAWEIERYPFRVEVEGHTQSGEPTINANATRWTLSTERALVAQQQLQEKGVRQSQFWRVAGYADRQPIERTNPQLEINRRLTIVLRLDPNSDFEEVRKAFSLP
jgi:chemotaxis protein MotB